MPSDEQHVGEGHTTRWPRPVIAPTRLESASLYTYVLDADSDLAEEFDIRSLVAARQLATARVLEVTVGECDLAPWFDAASRGLGVLILEGVVAIETHVGDRTASELVGAGDLLQFPNRGTDDLLERSYGWRALCPTQLALLDAEFADRVRPWPQIVQALLRRVIRRTADVDALRAITCQPRLEVRLVLLLWHLAARWGRVEPTGIRVTLPLTHRHLRLPSTWGPRLAPIADPNCRVTLPPARPARRGRTAVDHARTGATGPCGLGNRYHLRPPSQWNA